MSILKSEGEWRNVCKVMMVACRNPKNYTQNLFLGHWDPVLKELIKANRTEQWVF